MAYGDVTGVPMFHVKRAPRPPEAGSGSVYSAHSHRPPEPAASRLKEPQISYTSLLLAVLLGILHAAASPVIVVADAHPNLILVGVVLATTLRGFGTGVMWAFVGGLTANLLTREPLGSIPLALLVVAAATAGGERLFGRLSWIYPVAAVVVGSLAADIIALGVLQLVDPPLRSVLPISRIVVAAVLNGAIAAIVLTPVRL